MAKTKRKAPRRPPLHPSDIVLEVTMKPEDFPPLPTPLDMYEKSPKNSGDLGASPANPPLPENGQDGKGTVSFASKVKQNRTTSLHGIKLELKKVEDAKIRMEEEDCLDVENIWGFALIGYIEGRNPGLKAIRDEMAKWMVYSKLHYHPSGWYIFRFKTCEDRMKVLNNGPHFVFNRPLMLKVMPLDFDYGDEEIRKIPVWVQLPSLPISFWLKVLLARLVQKLESHCLRIFLLKPGNTLLMPGFLLRLMLELR